MKEIVIKIRDERNIFKSNGKIYANLIGIYECKVLPPGHGRLKDVSKIYNHIDALNRGKDKGKFTGVLTIINMAETIIEADKGKNEKHKKVSVS